MRFPYIIACIININILYHLHDGEKCERKRERMNCWKQRKRMTTMNGPWNNFAITMLYGGCKVVMGLIAFGCAPSRVGLCIYERIHQACFWNFFSLSLSSFSYHDLWNFHALFSLLLFTSQKIAIDMKYFFMSLLYFLRYIKVRTMN